MGVELDDSSTLFEYDLDDDSSLTLTCVNKAFPLIRLCGFPRYVSDMDVFSFFVQCDTCHRLAPRGPVICLLPFESTDGLRDCLVRVADGEVSFHRAMDRRLFDGHRIRVTECDGDQTWLA